MYIRPIYSHEKYHESKQHSKVEVHVRNDPHRVECKSYAEIVFVEEIYKVYEKEIPPSFERKSKTTLGTTNLNGLGLCKARKRAIDLLKRHNIDPKRVSIDVFLD